MERLDFQMASDLYVAGRDEDGQDFTAEVYYIMAEDANGNRWRHRATFPGCLVEDWTDAEGYSGRGFMDVRETARAGANRLLLAIAASGGNVNLDQHWTEDRPAYGSAAYVAYGQHDDWLEERLERFNETGLI